MEDQNKVVVFAVVALVIGAAIGVGIGFIAFNKNSNNTDETYYFYLNFGDNDVKTKWYSATGSNVDNALEKAMKDANITVNWGTLGYPSFDSNSWGQYCYTWDVFTKTAANESIKYPLVGFMDNLEKSNGWVQFAGFDETGQPHKMHQSACTVFYFAPYAEDFTIVDPVDSTLWINAKGTPFA